MSIAICLFNPSPGHLKTGLTSLLDFPISTFSSNLRLLCAINRAKYFTHTWSLGVEEQFYIISVPDLVSGFGRQTKKVLEIFPLVGILTIASLVGFLYLYPTNQPAAYFLMTSRFWEMAAGCLIFIGFQKRVSVEQLPRKFTSSRVGTDCGCDVSTDVYGICIYCRGSCLVIHPDRLLEEADSSIQGLHQPHCRLYRSDLILAYLGTGGCSRSVVGLKIHWWSVPYRSP